MGEAVNNICEIFKSMDYGNNRDSTEDAIQWLKQKENKIVTGIEKRDGTPSPSGDVFPIKNTLTDEILCNIYTPDQETVRTLKSKLGESKNKWAEVPPKERMEMINKFSNEIKKNERLLSQLEIVARGILSKDTKMNSIPLLTDYLRFYANFSVNKGSCVCSVTIDDMNCLSSFGQILGPCLAAGYRILLQTGLKLCVVATLLIELAIKAGIPDGTIILIYEDVTVYKNEYLSVTLPDNKKLHLSSAGVPMIVFDNSDLDSACQCAINGAWSYQGMLPWSIKKVFVQENIFEVFVKKLKHKISSIKFGPADDKNADFAFPVNIIDFKSVVDRARSEGVEVFQNQADKNDFSPTLFIGGSNFSNNVIGENSIERLPILTVTAFRTINEAVSLTNNTRDGLAACVWTESSSLANEIARKLQVGNIWVNSYGMFSADVSISPYKSSGNCYFGGREGFNEFSNIKIGQSPDPHIVGGGSDADKMEKTISEAKKAADSWAKLSRLERSFSLQTISIALNSGKIKLDKNWIDRWTTLINDCVTNKSSTQVSCVKSYNVVTFKEPCGVIAIENGAEDVDTNNKLLISGLLEGNSVIVLNESDEFTAFYSWLSAQLPKGVLSVLPLSCKAKEVAVMHHELNVYYAITSVENKKCKVGLDANNWNEIVQQVTLSKNVWFNVGQSFA